MGPCGDEGGVSRASNQGILQKLEIDIGRAIVAQAIGGNYHPTMAFDVSADMDEGVINISLRGRLAGFPCPGIRIVGPFQPATEGQIVAAVVSVNQMKRGRTIQGHASGTQHGVAQSFLILGAFMLLLCAPLALLTRRAARAAAAQRAEPRPADGC